ncbi:UvrD-helicase domain-containing protein [Aquimarina pacifica]|uniref:UvrD-helicase domain-containing protein n=1 Tax=Aquimarina pacifica TaxID=1296415 RepID=UPI00046EACAD|nr:UvrD-helicase domain-containing protein [Aquimarina pacifica]
MTTTKAFTVYNAAAGAGKTYTLVKSYLITLLKGEFKESYKNILAITFTNKAVAEMKIRVLENLVAISQPETPTKYRAIEQELIEETQLDTSRLKQKAKNILLNILHNYAAFDIVTIDTFTHRVIRTFAHDLGIPMNFEIEMDVDSLIKEAVDAVIAQIGLNKDLTRLIVDFAISKLEEDKSWDITIELNKIARLLFSENDLNHLNNLSNKSAIDFEKLKTLLNNKIRDHKKSITSQATSVLQLIIDKGVDEKDFMRGSIPKHFQKLVEGDLKVDFKTQWKQNISEATFYGAKLDDFKKDLIDGMRPMIEEVFIDTKNRCLQIDLFQNCFKNLTPLSVLHVINKELIQIKKERRILLISEFNTIISNAILDQPAPFIYERLGERYRDYFIDEFQDTSELQWNNLIPLIDNAVSTETLSGKRGKITIVGDAKQAIYRWRGGKAEQFIDLSSDTNPFSVKEKEVLNLPKNYRSSEEIIKFNNSFFTFLSNDFSDVKHQQLYREGNKQKVNDKKNGFVSLSFVKAKNVAEENEMYPEKVYNSIVELEQKGYGLNEICVIVRKQKEGSAIADYLTQKGMAIISSETLLIANAPQVMFIVNILIWYVQPEHMISKLETLHFLTEQFSIKEKHSFLQKMIHMDREGFSSELKTFGVNFDFSELVIKPLYDAIEYIIGSFFYAEPINAYLQFFLDTVFTFTQKHNEGIVGFLSYWDSKKDTLSIVAPETEKAIQIITIHKAKGLEFTCVIYPYAHVDIYREIEPKTWISVDKETYEGFDEMFIDYSKNIAHYSEQAQQIVKKRQSQLELDTFNLLYVVFTRAKEQLYVISNLQLNSKGMHNPNTFSGKLIAYLKDQGLWDAEKTAYTFGNFSEPDTITKSIEGGANVIKLFGFGNNQRKYKVHIMTNSGKLWDTSQQNAIEKGNLLHDLMARIYTSEDIDKVIDDAFKRGEIMVEEKKLLYDEIQNVVKHPELSKYFSTGYTIYNERDIVADGRLFRPDRILIDNDSNVILIDYKTGVYNSSHGSQLEHYAGILLKMGFHIQHKILVYFNDIITLKYI